MRRSQLAQRFVIFGLPRTGSSLLGMLLDGHPAISCDTEILHPGMWRKWQLPLYWLWRVIPYTYLAHRARRALVEGVSAYGFKLFPSHVTAPARVLPGLHGRGWRIIHIQRRDVFRQTLSLLVASHTGRYDGRHVDAAPRITIDPAHFGFALHQRVREIERVERILALLDHIDVIYEDDLADSGRWDATLDRICADIGVIAIPAQSEYRKTWSAPYETIVTNYESLHDAYCAGLFGVEAAEFQKRP